MRSAPQCLDCGLEQCRRMIKLVTGEEERWQEVDTRLKEMVPRLDINDPPGTYTGRLLLRAMELLGEDDPFRQLKSEQNREAAIPADELDRALGYDEIGLKQALMAAASGNVIDVGPGRRFDLGRLLGSLRFAHDDFPLLMDRLKTVHRVMYILDNCGEVQFDRLVLKRLPRVNLTIVARSFPILNDVTVEEAKLLGLGEFGAIIGTGSPLLGIDFKTVSPEFLKIYKQVDLVIAKGHANFESLVDGPRDGFYLLTAKCELVAARLKVKIGEPVCFYSRGEGG